MQHLGEVEPVTNTAAGLTQTAARKSRPYIFLGQTTSLCETCLELVPAKILQEEDRVYYLKRCHEHGVQKTLISTDAAYWKRCRDFLKPGDLPLKFHTRIDKGCPYDCGLCPDHEQHSCLALIEINEHCNLTARPVSPAPRRCARVTARWPRSSACSTC